MGPGAGDTVARTMTVAQRVKAEVTRGLDAEELDRLRGSLQRMRDNLARPSPAAETRERAAADAEAPERSPADGVAP
jgi:hypothetical protein